MEYVEKRREVRVRYCHWYHGYLQVEAAVVFWCSKRKNGNYFYKSLQSFCSFIVHSSDLMEIYILSKIFEFEAVCVFISCTRLVDDALNKIVEKYLTVSFRNVIFSHKKRRFTRRIYPVKNTNK